MIFFCIFAFFKLFFSNTKEHETHTKIQPFAYCGLGNDLGNVVMPKQK